MHYQAWRGNVTIKNKIAFLVSIRRIRSRNERFFDPVLVNVGCGAGTLSVVLVSALPDDLPVLVVAVPDLRAVELSAVPAEDLPGEDGLPGMRPATAAFHLVLNPLEGFWRDDRLVILLNMVHWNLSLVSDPLFVQEVQGIGFLKDFVSHVGFVSQDAVNCLIVPFLLSGRRRDTIGGQGLSNLQHRVPLQVKPMDCGNAKCVPCS